ncbi:MAG TPA: NAD(P)-binding domain-containing protein, partial [Candidatus Baltobacteraceae bacterium]|nr:NAD(P)-binding domain-containing protein [Candidatus Baltobacteraceae bacterium]
MNVAVIGLGYIGLPTAALLAEGGHEVHGYDVDARLRDDLRAGNLHIAEDGVRTIVHDALESGRLHVADCVPDAQAYIICVPTPAHEGHAVLTFVEKAASAVAVAAPSGALIVVESTVPPGTTDRVIE